MLKKFNIIIFCDTFLGMSNKEFDEFCEMYKDINLPFGYKQGPRQ